MSNINDLFELNFPTIIIGILLILTCIKYVVELIEWCLKKLGVKFNKDIVKRNFENRLEKTEQTIDETNNVIASMQNLQADSIEQFTERDKEISSRIDNIEELVKKVSETTNEIKNSLDEIREATKKNTSANIELLYQKITEKCDHYISINGIPNEEYIVLENLFKIYHDEGGNHGLKRKVDYCLNNLPILPDKQL